MAFVPFRICLPSSSEHLLSLSLSFWLHLLASFERAISAGRRSAARERERKKSCAALRRRSFAAPTSPFRREGAKSEPSGRGERDDDNNSAKWNHLAPRTVNNNISPLFIHETARSLARGRGPTGRTKALGHKVGARGGRAGGRRTIKWPRKSCLPPPPRCLLLLLLSKSAGTRAAEFFQGNQIDWRSTSSKLAKPPLCKWAAHRTRPLLHAPPPGRRSAGLSLARSPASLQWAHSRRAPALRPAGEVHVHRLRRRRRRARVRSIFISDRTELRALARARARSGERKKLPNAQMSAGEKNVTLWLASELVEESKAEREATFLANISATCSM